MAAPTKTSAPPVTRSGSTSNPVKASGASFAVGLAAVSPGAVDVVIGVSAVRAGVVALAGAVVVVGVTTTSGPSTTGMVNGVVRVGPLSVIPPEELPPLLTRTYKRIGSAPPRSAFDTV